MFHEDFFFLKFLLINNITGLKTGTKQNLINFIVMKKLFFAASFALAILATACGSKSNSEQLGEGVDSTVVVEEAVCDTVCPETETEVPCDSLPCEEAVVE